MLTKEFMNECLNYDPGTGIFTWKVRPRHHFKTEDSFNSWNKRCSLKKAGSINRRALTLLRSIELSICDNSLVLKNS